MPVYVVVDTRIKGDRKYRLCILTLTGFKYYQDLVEEDLKRYEGYSQILRKSGVIIHESAQAGTLQQLIRNGLWVSHSRQAEADFPNTYGWDIALLCRRAMLSGDFHLIEYILGKYQDYYYAVTMGRRAFLGFTQSFNAYTMEPAGGPDIAVTAAIDRKSVV